MPELNATELVYLRDQHPHTARVEWYLAVAPYGDPCFTAQVNNLAIVRGARLIDYDNDVGDGNVVRGMTLWIGSTPGARDLGKVRIKVVDALGNQLTVAENDDILWADGVYLTCPGAGGFHEIWGVYPRIDEVGGVVVFYNDYDDVYVNEGDHLPPKANAGAPVCAWIDPTTGVATVQFAGPDSYVSEVGHGWHGANPFAWTFPGGAPATSAVQGTCDNPVAVTFNTPGFRYVTFVVRDDQNVTGTVYIPVWIFEEGVEDPYQQVEVIDQSGSASGGWRCKLRVFDVDEDTIYDFVEGALVVLFTRTWYGDTEVNVGGYCHRENIRFAGWLQGETLNFDYEAGTVDFDAQSHDGVMRRIPGFAFVLEETAVPADWYEMLDLNADRALHHLLEYHSTVNQVCHVDRVGEQNTRSIAVQAFPDASLYAQAQTHLLGDAECLLLADRQGVIRTTQNPQFLDAAGRDGVDVVASLVSQDWMNELEESRPLADRVGMVRLGGFNDATPLLSIAPGLAPLQQEAVQSREGRILTGQAEANRWSGQALAKANNPFDAVPLQMSGYWPVFDPAFQEYVRLTVTDPLARRSWVADRFIVRETKFNDMTADGTTGTTLVLEKETEWMDGEKEDIPSAPPPEPPANPPAPWFPPEVPVWDGPVKAAVAWNCKQLGYTPDFLLHHVLSTATGGGGVNLVDTTVDFVAIGVVVGDFVENLTDGGNVTTVAAVVSATQITLTANINIDPGDDYHINGTQWVDIHGNISVEILGDGGDDEFILQFKYIRTGLTTVAGVVLTNQHVWYATNILTPTPVWIDKLDLTEITNVGGDYYDVLLQDARFCGIEVSNTDPDFVIVSLGWVNQASQKRCIYTTDISGATPAVWAFSTFVLYGDVGNQYACQFGFDTDESTRTIYNLRTGQFAVGQGVWMFQSVDNGVNFFCLDATLTGRLGASRRQGARGDAYRPFNVGNRLYGAVRSTVAPDRWSPSGSGDDGQTWLGLAIPAGYQTMAPDAWGGVNGWYGDGQDILALFETDDGARDEHLFRSEDQGALWTQIGDAEVRFPNPIACVQLTAIPETWTPDENVLIWVGNSYRETTPSCRIAYTPDNGNPGGVWHWCDKTWYWYQNADFDFDGDGTPEWCGASQMQTPPPPVYGVAGNCRMGNVGCIPLPRIGDNE